jgi:hypothetical protein
MSLRKINYLLLESKDRGATTRDIGGFAHVPRVDFGGFRWFCHSSLLGVLLDNCALAGFGGFIARIVESCEKVGRLR